MQGKRGPLTSNQTLAAASDCLGAEVYGRIVASEAAGGVRVRDLPNGSRLRVRTQNRTYELQIRDGETLICGHPRFCPCPVPVRVSGSSWGGSMLKRDYVGLGMRLEFQHPVHAKVTTSWIVSVQVL